MDYCRGSSVVERRPEKAGVASSILAPGTILAATFPSKSQDPRGDVGFPLRRERDFLHVLRDCNERYRSLVIWGKAYKP